MDTTLFIKKIEHYILLMQIYVNDIIFVVIDKSLWKEFSNMMHNEFEMSVMGGYDTLFNWRFFNQNKGPSSIK